MLRQTVLCAENCRNAEKHLPSLVQKHVSFLQLWGKSNSPAQRRVADFLRSKGSELNSRVLSALAVRVDADPFEKVKKMIKAPPRGPPPCGF